MQTNLIRTGQLDDDTTQPKRVSLVGARNYLPDLPPVVQSSNDDGIGDLRGIHSKLDYLQWLGVDAV